MKRALSNEGKGSLDLIEESYCLVRHHALSALPIHWLATFPFVLGLLYFISDMSRSAFAPERIFMGSLGLTFLFFWMKCGQAWYAAILRSVLDGNPRPTATPKALLSIAIRESFLQATGLIVLPLALLLVIPFGWAYAFYSNATVLAAHPEPKIKSTWKHCWTQATLWPGQNHYGLLALKLFFLFVSFNLGITMVAGPMLLKTLLGWDTAFSQSPLAMLNTTFVTSMLAVGYLCVDPLSKAFYTLRCFYGESLVTGSDLLSQLKRQSNLPLLVSAGLIMAMAPSLSAQTDSPTLPSEVPSKTAPESSVITSSDLDYSINQVIQKREYTWRLPRDKRPKDQDNDDVSFLVSLAESLGQSLEATFREIGRWIEKFFRMLKFNPGNKAPSGWSGGEWLSLTRVLLYGLLIVLAVLLTFLIMRFYKNRATTLQEDSDSSSVPPPDVSDESVGADALPENEWLRLAEELSRQGDLRLALRAFYLAGLAHLAQRNLVTIAKFKSNLDYLGELDRRSHALPEINRLFQSNVTEFDRAWYGLHEVTQPGLEVFARNVSQLCQTS